MKMPSVARLLIPLLCHVLWTDTRVFADCTKTGPCSCKGDKGVIDLSPIVSSGSPPRFKDILDSSGQWYFSYNPCDPFDEVQCTNVAACQIDGSMATSYPVGDQSSANFKTDSQGNNYIEYTSTGGDGTKRTTDVALVCDQSAAQDKLDVKGEDPPGSAIYVMTLTSKHCCFSAGPGPDHEGESSGLSMGSILCIAFLGLVFVYFAAGFAIQKGVRKAQGREAVPNYTFWSKVPGLIKDGVKFTVTCGKASVSYDKI